MLNTKCLSFAATLLLSVVPCAGSGLAQSQPTEVIRQTGRVEADPRMARSAAAVKLLRYTNEARRMLANGDQPQALAHINSALMMAEELGNRATVPVYTELEQVIFLGPIEAVQRDEKERAAMDPSDVNRAPAVKLTVGEYTRVALDVRQARTHLAAAKAALTDDLPAQADAALLALQNSVILESSATNLPLVRARRNLALALSRAREGQSQTMLDALKSAADSLGNYLLAPDAQRVREARALRGEIMNYALQSQPNPADATVKIGAWWTRVADWLDEPPALTQK